MGTIINMSNCRSNNNFGYLSSRGNDRKELHTTVNAVNFNRLKGAVGFKIEAKEDKVNLISDKKEILGYWDKETLKKSFEKKLPKVLYVKAKTKGIGNDEEYWFNEAWLLSGFSFENFLKLLKDGTILVDIRIGQYPNGKPHEIGKGRRAMSELESELTAVKRELALTKMERDILKKAAAYFAKESL